MKSRLAWVLLASLLVGCARQTPTDVATTDPADPNITDPAVVVTEPEVVVLEPEAIVSEPEANVPKPEPTVPEPEPTVSTPAPVDPRLVYEEIVGEYDEAYQAFEAEYNAATTRQARAAAQQDFYPDLDGYASRLMQLQADHPDASIAFDSLAWVVEHSKKESVLNTAIQQLAEKHTENPNVANICRSLGSTLSRLPTLEAEEFLDAVIESNNDHETQAWAYNALATYHSGLANMKELADSYPQYAERIKAQLDAAAHERIVRLDTDKNAAVRIALYEKIASDFGDVDKALAEAAESQLFVIKYLSVGREAPDIEGDDVDGETFRLSDYRGKVVFLDFWGDW